MHATIFQLSKTPIHKDDYFDCNSFALEDYGKYNIDYIDNMDREDRLEEIKQMGKMFPLEIFEVIDEKKIRYHNHLGELKEMWVKALKECTAKIDVETFFGEDSSESSIVILKELVMKPFTFNLFAMDDEKLYSSADFIYNVLCNLEDGDILYVGNVLDYHV